jgi:hypothetical protein
MVVDMVDQFPYAKQADYAAAWALLLTPRRPAIEAPVPLAPLDAPQQGTGKGTIG